MDWAESTRPFKACDCRNSNGQTEYLINKVVPIKNMPMHGHYSGTLSNMFKKYFVLSLFFYFSAQATYANWNPIQNGDFETAIHLMEIKPRTPVSKLNEAYQFLNTSSARLTNAKTSERVPFYNDGEVFGQRFVLKSALRHELKSKFGQDLDYSLAIDAAIDGWDIFIYKCSLYSACKNEPTPYISALIENRERELLQNLVAGERNSYSPDIMEFIFILSNFNQSEQGSNSGALRPKRGAVSPSFFGLAWITKNDVFDEDRIEGQTLREHYLQRWKESKSDLEKVQIIRQMIDETGRDPLTEKEVLEFATEWFNDHGTFKMVIEDGVSLQKKLEPEFNEVYVKKPNILKQARFIRKVERMFKQKLK
jgi:hypothetical protein